MGVELMSKLLGKDEIKLLEALSLGESLRLLQKSSERNAYAIHRLVAEVRKDDIPLEERINWINNISQLLSDWFQDMREDFTKLADYEAELEHLNKWQEQSELFSLENASRLKWLQGFPPYYRGKLREAQKIVKEAIKLFFNLGCHNQETLAHLYSDFSGVSRLLKEPQIALEYAKKSLEIRLEILRENNKDTAISYSLVGSAYGDLKNYQEQYNFAKKALEINTSISEEIDKDTATFYDNLGVAYGDLGKHKDEFDNKQKALDIRLNTLNSKHPDLAHSYYNISFCYEWKKNYDKAVEYADKSLKIYNEVFGELHPDTLNSASLLSKFLTLINKGNEALKLIDNYLHIIPKNNPEYKRFLDKRAWILDKTRMPGFRQQPVKPTKKKRKKKRR